MFDLIFGVVFFSCLTFAVLALPALLAWEVRRLRRLGREEEARRARWAAL